jgi:hypothetical protein
MQMFDRNKVSDSVDTGIAIWWQVVGKEECQAL